MRRIDGYWVCRQPGLDAKITTTLKMIKDNAYQASGLGTIHSIKACVLQNILENTVLGCDVSQGWVLKAQDLRSNKDNAPPNYHGDTREELVNG